MVNTKYNKYVGARYVPKFDGEWSASKEYEPLVIVSNQGNSYTSKTFIPKGIDINNIKYWALTGNYNAQVEYYRQEVKEIKTEVEVLSTECLQLKNIVNVTPEYFGAKGDGVNDDREGIQKALDFINSKGGGTLTFKEGRTYLLKSFTDTVNKNILKVYSNTLINGGGNIKINNQFGDYKTIFSQGDTMENVTIKDLIIDENTINNPWLPTSGKQNEHRSSFFFYNLLNKNIILKDIIIKDCIGIWQISIAGNKSLLENITIYYGTSDSRADRSCIYNACSNSIVKGCSVYGSNCSRTAFESHNANQTFIDNFCIEINVALYIAFELTEKNYLQILNNNFKVKKEAISFWLIDNNPITTEVIIKNNTLTYSSDVTHTQGLISFFPNIGKCTIDTIIINSNTLINESNVKNSYAFDIRGGGMFTLNNLSISDNTVIGKYEVAFSVSDETNGENPFKIKNIMINNNTIISDLTALFRGVMSDNLNNVSIIDNNILGTAEYGANFYGKSTTIYIRYGKNKFTKITNAQTEITKANEITPDIDNLNLINDYYMSNAPYVGQWKKGQIVYNDNPSPNSPIGWICTKGGNTYNGETIAFNKFGIILTD